MSRGIGKAVDLQGVGNPAGMAHAVRLNSLGHPPYDPQVAARDALIRRVDTVARSNPAARVGWWLLENGISGVVPLDLDLEPAADPLTDLDSVLGWFGSHPDHGVAVPAGRHRQATLAGVQVDSFEVWREFVEKHGTDVHFEPDRGGWIDGPEQDNPPIERKVLRHVGSYSRAALVPPPLPSMATYRLDHQGGDYRKAMKNRRERGGWVIFAVADEVRFPSKPRKVAKGIQLLGEGAPIPWEARRKDGWTVQVNAAAGTGGGIKPGFDPPAAWLLDELGLGKER